MNLSSDLILTHPLWEKAQDDLINRLGIFNRLIDLFLIACSIGIRDDKQINSDDIDTPLSQPRSIGRNTYLSAINTDLSDLLNLMLQNSILTSKCLNMDLDERLKLSFNPDYENKKFSPANFLIGFANYGIVEIFDHINCDLPATTVSDDLYAYLNTLRDNDYEDLINTITLDDLI